MDMAPAWATLGTGMETGPPRGQGERWGLGRGQGTWEGDSHRDRDEDKALAGTGTGLGTVAGDRTSAWTVTGQ